MGAVRSSGSLASAPVALTAFTMPSQGLRWDVTLRERESKGVLS